MAKSIFVGNSQAREDPPSNGHHISYAVDYAHLLAASARILDSAKELHGPYEACIATYGSEEQAERIVVTIVDMRRRLIVDHRSWFISEYADEASRCIEGAVDVLTDDVMDYCKRCRVGRVFMIDKPFPLKELEEKCPFCGEERVRVPWQDR